MQANQYKKLQETVRAQPHLEVLQKLDTLQFDNVQDLVSMVSEVEVSWQLKIGADEALRPDFWNDWKIMEDIECNEKAQVPERWHAERKQNVSEERAKGAGHWKEYTIPEMQKFVPDYTPDWDLLLETRHRRLIPLGKNIVKQRTQDHMRYVGEV